MSIVWFRKCLRIHDNASLIAAIEAKQPILPLFILDPNFIKYGRCGINRWNFLFQTLADLDNSLKKLGSTGLTVLRGSPSEVFELLFKSKKFKNLFFEKDTEPYALERDALISDICSKHGIEIETFLGHTLYDPEEIRKANKGLCPSAYGKFTSIIDKLPKISECARDPQKGEIKSFSDLKNFLDKEIKYKGNSNLPTIHELVDKSGNKINEKPTQILEGGETIGLEILKNYLSDKKKTAEFEKPKTSPAAFNPASTTVLSPYLKFGSVSIKKFYFELKKVLREYKGKISQPPVSLLGQIYWREFFYTNSYLRENFHKMKNNSACKEINWHLNSDPISIPIEAKDDPEKKAEENFNAWKTGRTGYPWIDAMMIQLAQEGWIHHLGRHCVACFLTRGDLYINWERGMEVFDELLLDADYALNAGNWLWLSGTSVFFTAYFRIYSPVAFGKKYDPNGNFIRKYLPQLKDFPKEFIYEPWKAPKALQKKLNCLIGVDYPERIVIHEEAQKINLQNLSAFFGKGKAKQKANAYEEAESASEDDENKDESDFEDTKPKKNNKKANLNKTITSFVVDKRKAEKSVEQKSRAKSTPKSTNSNKSGENNKKISDLFLGNNKKETLKEATLASSLKDDENELDYNETKFNALEDKGETKINNKIKSNGDEEAGDNRNDKKLPVIKINKKNSKTNAKDANQVTIEDSFDLSIIGLGRKRNYSSAFKGIDVEVDKKVHVKKPKK